MIHLGDLDRPEAQLIDEPNAENLEHLLERETVLRRSCFWQLLKLIDKCNSSRIFDRTDCFQSNATGSAKSTFTHIASQPQDAGRG